MLSDWPDSYLSPKLESRPNLEKGGQGVFAVEPISKGEVLAVWGGTVLTGEVRKTLPATALSLQVEENLYLVSSVIGPADYINHCCDPNAGMYGQVGLIAMRAIAPDEEVCYDYAMSDGSPYDEFECACGADICRKQITGNDWRNPQLWRRYAGYFSPYLQRRIDGLREQRAAT